MSTDNANLRIDGLDFDIIKSNLKDFLRSQTQFKDYDFEGSGMNILLDLLAYNTHYQAFYANMVANEAFLDSSVLRPSAVSVAKHLGYTPRSIKSSKIEADIIFNSNTIFNDKVTNGSAFINRGDIFRGYLGNTAYNFVALESSKVKLIGGVGKVSGIKLYEGSIKSYTFVKNSYDPSQKFILPSKKIDVDTLSVRVQESTTNTLGIANTWFKATDVNGLNSGSLSYFLQESDDENFEIYFGDGILGKKIRNGNVITVEYVQTNGEEANGCSNFSMGGGAVSGYVNRVVPVLNDYNVNGVSYGGAISESIESIKYYAPRNYQAQERAVTEEDYKTILVKEFSDGIESFLVWGGEQNIPPAYGKVFISIKPKNGKRVSVLEKLALEKSVLSNKNIVGITPEIVDPDYIYLEINSVTNYNPNTTNLSAGGLSSFILNNIKAFESDNLSKFGKNFKMSKFLNTIDSTNVAITGSKVRLKLSKRIEPLLAYPASYTIRFDNMCYHPIEGYKPILESSSFGFKDTTSSLATKPTVDAQMDDDGYGNVRVYKTVGNTKTFINKKAGKIDYATGIVTLDRFTVQYINPKSESEISIKIVPDTQDVLAKRNQIIVIDYGNSNIEVEPETTFEKGSRSATPFPY